MYSSKNYEESKQGTNYEINSYKQYLKDISQIDILSKDEFKKIFILYKNGDVKAKEKLILGNLRLVIEASKQFQGKGLELLDLIEEGNLGLIKAIEHYDINRGCPFATYALIWINQSIRRAIALKTRNIKLPVLPSLKLNKFLTTRVELAMELKREPSSMEIAQQLGEPVEEINALKWLQYDTISFNNIVLLEDGNEENNLLAVELGDTIPDENNQLEKIVIIESMREEIDKLFNMCNLSEREKEILYYRFGLKGREETVYRALKEHFGISGERIRIIEKDVILKLRRSEYIKNLAEFMDNPKQAVLSLKKYQKQKKKKENIII